LEWVVDDLSKLLEAHRHENRQNKFFNETPQLMDVDEETVRQIETLGYVN